MTVLKALILGGSRGLGKALKDQIPDACSVSRKSEISIDFSKSGSVEQVLKLVEEQKPTHIFYSAGGGPHGEFFEKPVKSHEWAFQVNFFTPVAIVKNLIEKNYQGVFVYIGLSLIHI